MKFSEAIEEIKNTGGIIGLKHWGSYCAVIGLKEPMIMLDENCEPMENEDYKPHEFKSKWLLWDISPDNILDTDWEVKEVFSPERKEYFSHIYG